jgi:hypothetical protein
VGEFANRIYKNLLYPIDMEDHSQYNFITYVFAAQYAATTYAKFCMGIKGKI